jgi:hypothetical protein
VVSRLRQRVFAAGVALSAVFAWPADAGAATTTARLVYLRGAGTESCPDERELIDAVAARLGYDPFTPFSLETLFTEVDKDGSGFVARVKLVSHDNTVRGARTLQTRGACSDLMASLALTISIAIDPMAGTRKGPPEGLPPGERPVDVDGASQTGEAPAEPTPEPAPAAPPTAAPPSPRVVFAIGGGPLASVGYASAPALGLAIFGRARIGDFSIALEGRGDLPAGTDVSEGGRVRSSLLAVSLLPCGHAGVLFGCARGTVGRLAAEGLDVTDPGSSGAIWGAVGLRAGAEIPFGRVFALRIAADGDAVLTRYALRINGETRFRYSAVAGDLGLAAVATFP